MNWRKKKYNFFAFLQEAEVLHRMTHYINISTHYIIFIKYSLVCHY